MRFCCNGQLWKKPINHWDHTDCCRWILEAQFSYKQYQTRTPFLNNRSFLCRFVFVFILFCFVFFKLTSYILIKRNPQAEAFWQYVMDYTSRCSLSTQIPLSKINCETSLATRMGTMEYHIKWFLPHWFCVLFSNSCRLSLHMESGNRWWSSRNSKTQMNCSIFNPYSRSRFCRASHFSKMVALNLDVRINLEWVKILSTFL